MKTENPHELIIKTLKEKSMMKQDVYHNTLQVFKDLKIVVKNVAAELKTIAHDTDKRLVIDFRDEGEFEIRLAVAGDLLVFHMHTNVFEFDRSHQMWKSSYVKENPQRAYCGMIHIYNFLSDSFKYNRMNDLGYLIGRIFINKDLHYFVEGKRQLGFLYNDFAKSVLDKEGIASIVESAILYCLSFDLLTPPFDSVKEVTVSEITEVNNSLQIRTGKRLGFRFQSDTDNIE